jgi:hypothetical protein
MYCEIDIGYVQRLYSTYTIMFLSGPRGARQKKPSKLGLDKLMKRNELLHQFFSYLCL